MSLFGNLFADGKTKVETTDINKRFNLIARVGQGSMSKVWRADDQINQRFVAVKVLDKEKTKRYENRFRDLSKPSEGEIALSLKHPNIVSTYEVGFTQEEEMFLVMEYVEGAGLSLLVDLQTDQMRQYRTRYMIQIGEALKHFHDQNWIHRDICPRNIMVTEKNEIKLIDFGLTVPNTPDFRKPGNRTGTANYMAPELIKRHPTDQRIDIFSYAVTCYEMYAKRHPWDAAMTIDAVLHHINQPPLQLTKLVPRINPDIAEVIMKGLEVNPDDRWATVAEMVTAFRNIEKTLVKETQELLKRRKQSAAKKKAPRPESSNAAEGKVLTGSGHKVKSDTPADAQQPQKKKKKPAKPPVAPPADDAAADDDDEILSLDLPVDDAVEPAETAERATETSRKPGSDTDQASDPAED